MTNTQRFAKQELDILEKTTPNAIIIPFKKEILALCEAFGKSGQSSGSAPMTAKILTNSIMDLLLFSPICDITGHDEEWINCSEYNDGSAWFQNKRCRALFKDGDNRPYYIDAIVWKGSRKYDTFTGRVYKDNVNFELISSSQFVKTFPFKPKTFYIDVVRIPVKEEDAKARGLHYIKDIKSKCYYSVVKSIPQLNKVWKYYDKKK